MEDLDKLREQFPVTQNVVFLDHAAQSPLPKPAADALHKYIQESSSYGSNWVEEADGGKPYFAKLIGARSEEVAFVESTSMGLNIVANMLHYPPGSKIVTTDLEYPSVVYPWLRRQLGVKVHYVKNREGIISLDDIEKAVDDKTVAVAISHVEYTNGFRNNLRVLSEIAHDHDAYLIVDAIQSAGAMPMDASRDDVDFLTAACYKWLLGPPGAAYLYVKDELIEKFEPPLIGWASVDQNVFKTEDFYDIWKLRLTKTAARFEVGSPSMISLVGARASMKMLLDEGIENVKNRIMKLTGYLMKRAEDDGFELQTPKEEHMRSGIVNIKTVKAENIAQKLAKKRIKVSARDHGIRVAPHYYNTEHDIDTLLSNIKKR